MDDLKTLAVYLDAQKAQRFVDFKTKGQEFKKLARGDGWYYDGNDSSFYDIQYFEVE